MLNPLPGAASARAREELLAESQELVDEAHRELDALEVTVAAGGREPARVHALFRCVHTLKGLASTFGLDGPASLADALEDALDRLRLDRDTLDQSAVDRINRALDHLSALLEHERAGVADDGAETERIARELRGSTARSVDRGAIPVDPSVLSTLTEYEEHRLRVALGVGASLWRLRADAPLDAIERSLDEARALSAAHGEVITVAPGGLSPDGGSLELAVLFTSTLDEAALRDSLERHGRRLESAMSTPAARPSLLPVALDASASRALRSVRVDIGRLDELMALTGELSLLRAALDRADGRARAGDTRGAHAELSRLKRDFGRNLDALQRALLDARMVPLGQVFERVASEVRKRSRRLSRSIRLVVTGADTAVDKLIVEELGAPLLHLVRNAVDHGIEAPELRASRGKSAEGALCLNAWQVGGRVVIEVEDDGGGIDRETIAARAVQLGMITAAEARALDHRAAMEILFHPGFTTRDRVTDTSGRGVGLDVVRASLARVGGAVDLSSEPGVYTRATLTLPITLAILPVLLLGVSGRCYALPLSPVVEVIRLTPERVRQVDGHELLDHGGHAVPLCRLDALFGHPPSAGASRFAVVIALGGSRAALTADVLVGQRDVVVKPLGRSLRALRWFAGATDLGEERAGLVLDVVTLVDEAQRRRAKEAAP